MRMPSVAPFATIPETTGVKGIPSIPLKETKLFDEANYHDVTVSLTDLLNCEAVRNDPEMRLWTQSRLMEAQQELRRLRRRRVSAPTIEVNPSMQQIRKFSS